MLVKTISIATNERVSFTRSGMSKRVKWGRKKKKCDVCVYDLASVCSESKIGQHSSTPLRSSLCSGSQLKTTQLEKEHAAKHCADGSRSGDIPPANRRRDIGR